VLCRGLGMSAPCPDAMIGALAAFPLPDSTDPTPSKSPLYLDPLQDRLLAQHGIEVPVIPWPRPPKRLLRVSAQLYNSLPQYEQLASALKEELA
jgi:isopenicillin-N epimerase